MSFAPQHFRLSVLLDVRSPFSYLALHPTLAFAESLGLDVDWLPLATPPLHPPSEPAPDDDRGARHRRSRAEALAREIETYAHAQGLVLRDPYRAGPADHAHLGWLFFREHHRDRLPRFLAALFRAYWAEGLDPDSPAAVAAQVGACGGERDRFLAWAEQEGPQAAASLAEELRAFGLFQVPAYVIEDEVFYGRQHLPMIHWIVAGRKERPPI